MFYFDFPIDIQNFLNQYSLTVHIILFGLLALLAFVTYKNPLLGACGVIILLPTYLFRTKLFGVPSTFLEISFLTVIAVFFLRGVLKKEFKKTGYRYPLQKPIFLLLLASIIAVLVSPNLRAALGLWKAYIIEPIIFFVFLLNIVKTDRDKEMILWALGLSALPLAILAIFQKFTGFGIALAMWETEESRRVTAIFTSPNAVGLYLGPITALYLSWMTSKNKLRIKNKENVKKNFSSIILQALLLILMILAIIFTVSQGTWLGIAAAFFYVGFTQINKKWMLPIVIIAFLIIFLTPQIRHKLLPVVTFSDRSGQNRIDLWKGSAKYLLSSPQNFLLGAGFFGFPNIHEQFRDPKKVEPLIYPHNIILNFWMETGLLGVIAFFWLCFDTFKKRAENDRSRSIYRLAAQAAIITIVAHGLVDVPYFKNDLSFLFWTILSLR